MIQYLFIDTSKLLNISDITKRIGNFFKLPIQLFMVFLIPNSRYKFTKFKWLFEIIVGSDFKSLFDIINSVFSR